MKNLIEQESRGIHNNNPLNIVKGSFWLGLDQEKTSYEPKYCVFVNQHYGWRAAAFLILRYYFEENRRSIFEIAQCWCRLTSAYGYAYSVSHQMHIDMTSDLRLSDPLLFNSRLRSLLLEFACKEHGAAEVSAYYDFDAFDDAIYSAEREFRRKYLNK